MKVACPARRRLTEVNLLGMYPRRTISVFDPMEFSLIDVLGARAMQTDFGQWPDGPLLKPSCSKRVSGHKAANPPTGFGPHWIGAERATRFRASISWPGRKSSARYQEVRSTCAAVGSLRLVTVEAGPMTRLGYLGETPRM